MPLNWAINQLPSAVHSGDLCTSNFLLPTAMYYTGKFSALLIREKHSFPLHSSVLPIYTAKSALSH